jgi:3-hydroxybutyrate dehydrogenase
VNVAMMTPGHAGSRPLDGKVSLVTGSTSGIGLGIARALSAAGSSIVLNGFGKTEEIAAVQDAIKSDFSAVPFIRRLTCQSPRRSKK